MSVENGARSAVTAAFLCGWAASDASLLPMVPQIIADRVGLAAVTLDVEDRHGHSVVSHAHARVTGRHPSQEEDTLRFEAHLDGNLTLRIAASPLAAEPIAAWQMELFRQLAGLVQGVLGCVLAQQHDRQILGPPFDRLSDREWEVCQALQGQDKEEKIATALLCSHNTLHCHVRRIYKKLNVKGRKELVALLLTARQRLQQRAIKRLGRKDRSGETADA